MAAKRNKIVWLRLDELKPHPTAQRRLSPAKVKEIVRDLEFDLTAAWDAIGTLHVVLIDGQYWIVDGQHRWSALVRCGFGDQKVACEVHEGATDHAAASKLFLRLNNRAIVGTFDRWLNEVQSGDPVAVGAKKLVESFGLRVALRGGDGIIACVNTLKRTYQIDEGATLRDVLNILNEAYGLTHDAVEGKLIEGLAIVSAKFNGELDRQVLAKKLAKYPGRAPSLIGDAKGVMRLKRGTMARAVAEVIVDTYNVQRRADNRLVL